MRKVYVAGALGILAFIAALYPWMTAKQADASRAVKELHAEIAQLRTALVAEAKQRERASAELRAALTSEATQREHAYAELEARMRARERAVGSSELAQASASGVNQAAKPSEAPAREGAPRAREPAVEIHFDPREFLDSVFAEQSADPSWTHTAEWMVEDKLMRQLPQGSRIQSVACHTSICRIETVHSDLNASEEFLAGAFKDPNNHIWAGDASSEVVQGPSGELVIVTYLSREGESLPDPSVSPRRMR